MCWDNGAAEFVGSAQLISGLWETHIKRGNLCLTLSRWPGIRNELAQKPSVEPNTTELFKCWCSFIDGGINNCTHILNIQPVLKSVFCNHNICALMVWGGASVYSVYSVVYIYLYILYHLRMERITYESMGKSLSMLDGDFAEYLRSYQ